MFKGLYCESLQSTGLPLHGFILKWRMNARKISLLLIIMMTIKIMKNLQMMMRKIIGQCRSQEGEEIIGKIMFVLKVVVCKFVITLEMLRILY